MCDNKTQSFVLNVIILTYLSNQEKPVICKTNAVSNALIVRQKAS